MRTHPSRLLVVANVLACLLAAPAFAGESALPEGRIAVLVHTTANAAALQDVAERVYPGVIALEPGGDVLFTDGRGEMLRARIDADRLIVLEQHTTSAGVRILRLRAFDKTGEVQRRTVEVTENTVAERTQRTLEGLPSWRPREARVSDWLQLATTDDAAFFDVNVFGGRKMLSESDWGPLATQNEVGGFATIGGTRWPVHLALEGYGARSFDDDTSVTITEFGFGARRILDLGRVIRPHLGAGIVFVRADYILVGALDEHTVQKDRGTGGWISFGASYRMGKYGNVGAQIRYSAADVTLGSKAVPVGGIHAGIAIGFGSARPAPK